MKIKEKIILGYSFLKAKLFNQKKPIIVSWEITRRCNLRCIYCHVWSLPSLELSTPQVLGVIKKLFKAGTKMIRFTGGEPLLRNDISSIINYTKKLDISVAIATNGILFPEMVNEIRALDAITLSLDGPADTHDSTRGLGSYKKTIEALNIAKIKNIPASLSATLNSLNLGSIDYLLELARYFRVKIFFQPVTNTVLYGEEKNPIVPDRNLYSKAMRSLISAKNKNKFIGNSTAALRHLSFWPDKMPIKCIAGKIIYRIDSEGYISPCSRFHIEEKKINIIENDIKHCFAEIYSPSCQNCWCSLFVELNMITSFNVDALINAAKN